jgi:hypothetical protein
MWGCGGCRRTRRDFGVPREKEKEGLRAEGAGEEKVTALGEVLVMGAGAAKAGVICFCERGVMS